jgi:pyruvate/2-oxoglutarate dehydrogenase complex dihydrolipoamide dehydrogenase (E3) component
MKHTFDVAVIGGGPGGLVVASVAAQTGLRVCLVEKEALLGGDCLHTGCVPSKSLLHLAQVVHDTRQAVQDGVFTDDMPGLDFNRVIERVQAAIAAIQPVDDPERFRGYGCEVRFGKANFISPQQLAVDGDLVTARRFVIATGSYPSIPPIAGLEESGYYTNETIFTQRSLPRSLAVLGGGPVGVELAQAFARFGSRVTLIEAADRILAGADPVAGAALAARLEAEGVCIRTGAGVQSVRRDGDSRQLQFADGSTLECERILVATGRKPALTGLGLEQAGVDFRPSGIVVDRRMRTSQQHIYAVGDVCGPYAFTHMAEYQAGIALANIVFRFPKQADYRVVPRVVYSDPELASVGLTPAEADTAGIRYAVAEFPVAEIDRAITDDRRAGLARILIRKGQVIGASLLAPHAGELIHELALAMRLKAKVKEITELVHAYPTYAQLHRRTINRHYAHLLQSRKVRWLTWLLHRLLP